MSEPCPCGSGRDYSACCGPVIAGKAKAQTAEALDALALYRLREGRGRLHPQILRRGRRYRPKSHQGIFQPVVTADPVVDMGDIISRAQVVKLFEGNGFTAAVAVFEIKLVIALEDLVIGIKCKFQFPVDKTFMQRNIQCRKVEIPWLLSALLQVFENRIDPFDLAGVFRKDKIADAFL